MTRKLEELFELPSEEKEVHQPYVSNDDTPVVTEGVLDSIDKIERALPQVKGLEASDGEMDELASLATSSYKDLMDLGMQVDSRFASEIFNSASSMLGHAITAKTAKLNKKLKMIELQLKKAALDHKMSEKSEEIENTPVGSGQLLDRNELLKVLVAKSTENDK